MKRLEYISKPQQTLVKTIRFVEYLSNICEQIIMNGPI